MTEFVVNSEVGGVVWKVAVTKGQAVETDHTLLVVESMKLEVPITAPGPGVVIEVLVSDGEVVTEDQPLVRMKSA